MARNSLTSLGTPVTETTFTKLTLNSKRFVNNFYAESHENPTNGLVTDTGSQMDGRAGGRAEVLDLHIKRSFSYFVRYA